MSNPNELTHEARASGSAREEPSAHPFGEMLKTVVARPEFVSFLALILLTLFTAYYVDFSHDGPGRFLTLDNLTNITRQVAVTSILAVGMTFVILTGGIDLSVGAVVALTSTLMAGAIIGGVPFWGACGIALLVGIACGAFSGFFVARFSLPAIIVTLAMMEMARGLGLLYSGGNPLPISFEFGFLARNFTVNGFPVPIPTLIMLAMFLIGYVILNRLPIGRYIYAVGGNEEAAILSGIRTRHIKMFVYVVSGFMAAVAGIIQTARVTSGQPNSAIGFELDAIAAVVLGGTSIAGGRGHIVGTLIGALLLGVLNNALNMLEISPYTQRVVKGVVILIAVLIGVLRKKK
ncbi:sugar ABC transporter permease [Betaproteobacteria bacterium]|nr:sugar ABC transporter permease [Betaproteobacteria bacterium]